MNNKYAKAYTEVLEILSYFSKEEYSKIPKEKIEFYKNNMDRNYEFKINPEIDLSEQHISKETNAIMISLFRDYFATEKQKEKLKVLLYQNQNSREQTKREKYKIDNLFINREKFEIEQKNDNNLPVEVKKEKLFEKINSFIKKYFKI